MPEDKVTAYEIIDVEGFCNSISEEAFNDSALLVGKSFFRRKKKDLNVFRKNIIGMKSKYIPEVDEILDEAEKYIFSTPNNKRSSYILPEHIDNLIDDMKNRITYKMLSHLTDVEYIELCYSPLTEDIVWRIKK